MAGKEIDEPSEEIVENARKDRAARRGPFARLSNFIKQVVAELKKVVTPTRSELFTYTGVVLVFVVFIMALVYFMDWVFGLGVVWAFGNPAVSK